MLAEEVSCLLPARRRSDPLLVAKEMRIADPIDSAHYPRTLQGISVVFVVKKSPEQIYALNETKSVSLAFFLLLFLVYLFSVRLSSR